MVKRVPKGSKNGGQFSPLDKGKKAPTAGKKKAPVVAKKSKVDGSPTKKKHLTNEEVQKQIHKEIVLPCASIIDIG